MIILLVPLFSAIFFTLAVILCARILLKKEFCDLGNFKKNVMHAQFFKPVIKILTASSRVKTRRELEKGVQRVIDLLRLYVSAGQNLESAFGSVAVNISGAWRGELEKIVCRLSLGIPFKEVLRATSTELNLSDFNRLIMAIEQSRILGVSLAGTLGVQSNLLRQRRKQLAEADARTASVKISLPLVLCIFPALLIVYLAPAVLRLVEGV